MNVSVTVPVEVSPEAAAHVAGLGMVAELDRMLEHTGQAVSGLRRLRVVLDPGYEPEEEPVLVIEGYRTPQPDRVEDRTRWEWGGWKVRTFPPDVCRHFTLLLPDEPGHAG
jgi:hypothetical protein